MEKKELAFQSFERNQGILEAINKLLIHLKLEQKGLEIKTDIAEANQARLFIQEFLSKLGSLVANEQNFGSLAGIDMRYRSLVRKYMEAKGKRRQFKSLLFRSSPNEILSLLQADGKAGNDELISSLTEFRKLLSDHGFSDLRELIGNI
ncbi:MAG: hypothetical protein EOO20_02880 [Chryseobacterium sp.]|uniref:hypothetical protein n=1 Tax=Pedobacter agri TaxID=454586 RepID=UPI00122455D5|nr:hypothetical protein [Pedobacter agri]RZJ92131.1 MAG: hypothetical protein EOO20_02880 [Chryseobacterium sp.]